MFNCILHLIGLDADFSTLARLAGQARNVQNQGGVDPRSDAYGGAAEIDDKLEEEDAGGKKTLYGRIKAPFQDSVANSKDLANQHATRGKKFLTEDYFPKERREQWIWRGKKVCRLFFSGLRFSWAHLVCS